MATAEVDAERVREVRAFNRFYTTQIGVLREGLLDSAFPLTEARVIYELAARVETTAKDLARDLDLDAGYLSRILRGFRARGLVEKRPAEDDRRKSILSLSSEGKREFAVLDELSRVEIAKLLAPLSERDRARLVEAMGRIRALLSPPPGKAKGFVLRPHRPGDMGRVVALHGWLYAEMFGFDESFEALVARIAADFIDGFDSLRECAWIAEVDGGFVGSALVVEVDETTSKLRLMILDPEAQGLGIGRALLNECLGFARRKGYARMTLWTNDVQTAARQLYASAGFELVGEEAGHDFGVDLVAETWELAL